MRSLIKFRSLAITFAFITLIAPVFAVYGQAYYCKQRALNVLRTIPKLKYDCGGAESDYGDEVLKNPRRISAIRRYAKTLETFNDAAWWNVSVDDLTYCDIRKKVGRLTKKEKDDLNGGEYYFTLFGDHQMRVVSALDPCFSTGYGGADIFLLYRPANKVYATEIIDGFTSRADNAIGADFATLGKEKMIEIGSTTGGLHPMIINYYFTIHKRTNRAVPKNLFRDEKGKPTHIITSDMPLGEPEEYGLPPKSEPLVIFKNGRLAKSFVTLDDTFEQKDDEHTIFKKTILRWNGKYYK